MSSQIHRDRKEDGGCWGWGRRKGGVHVERVLNSACRAEKTSGDEWWCLVRKHCECTYWTIHLKLVTRVNLKLGIFYHSFVFFFFKVNHDSHFYLVLPVCLTYARFTFSILLRLHNHPVRRELSLFAFNRQGNWSVRWLSYRDRTWTQACETRNKDYKARKKVGGFRGW